MDHGRRPLEGPSGSDLGNRIQRPRAAFYIPIVSPTTAPSRPCRTPDGAQGVRRSKKTRWRAAVLIGVHLLFALHIAHLWTRGSTVSPVEPSEAMEYSKHSVVNAGLVFFAAAILATLVFGRFFCGWGCHLVALQDLCRGLLVRVGIRPRPLRSRVLALVPLVAFVYMFLWPLAYRLWIGDDFSGGHSAFYTSDFWRTFPGLVVALLTFAVCGFAIVYFLGSKGFCTYACPYGAIFGAVDRLAPGRIRVTDACEGCGHCTATCTSNVVVHKEVREHGMVVDPGCMKCMDCVSVCPKDALYFGFGKPALGGGKRGRERRSGGLPWGEEILLGVAAFLAFRGLYEAIPFLLSLGLGAIAAFLTLCAWRLLRRTEVRLQNLTLKSGRLTAPGRVFSVGFLAFALLWAHSGWIQVNASRARSAMAALAEPRERIMSAGHAPLDEGQRAELAALARHNRVTLDHGLVDTADAAYREAWVQILSGDREGYARWMERAVELDRRRGTPALELAGFLAAVGDLDGAERHYRHALELTEDPVEVGLELGRFLARRRGDLAASRAVLGEVLGEHPEAAALHHAAGMVAAAAGDEPQALVSLERAVELAPEHFEYRDQLARALLITGAVEDGLEVLREGARRFPERAPEQTALGLACLSAGRLAEAEAALRRAIELDPTGARDAMAALAQLLQSSGRVDEAGTWAARARDGAPGESP